MSSEGAMDEYVKPSEVAARLHVSRQVIYKWFNEGKLAGARFGKSVRILRSSLEEFERNAQESPEKNETPRLMTARAA